MTGELPSGWASATVDEVAAVQGGIQKQPNRRPAQNPFPFLRVANVMRGRLDLGEVHEIELFDGEIDRLALQTGDLLVVEGNGSSSEIGRAALWKGEIDPCVHQNHLIRVRPASGLDPKYLAALWNSPVVAAELRSVASSTSGLLVLSSRKVKAVRLPIAPGEEQGRVVAAVEEQLSRLDNASRLLQTASRRLAQIGAAILDSVLWGDGPRVALGDLLVDIEAGRSFACLTRRAMLDEWGVIKVSAMTWGRFDADEQKALPPAAKVDPRWVIVPGDLLLSRANTSEYVGATVLVGQTPGNLLLSDKSMRLVVHDKVDKRWLLGVLRSPRARRQMSGLATGSKESMRNISQAKVRSILVPDPFECDSAALADEVDRRLSAVDALGRAVRAATLRSETLRRAILAAAFRGELVPQDPADEPAADLLARIASERPVPTRRTRKKNGA